MTLNTCNISLIPIKSLGINYWQSANALHAITDCDRGAHTTVYKPVIVNAFKKAFSLYPNYVRDG